MRTLRLVHLRLLVLSPLALSPFTLTACSSSPGEGAAGTTEQAVFNVSEIDLQYPAVVKMSVGCTGTLVARDMVLAAAHCFSQVAQGCQQPSDAIAGQTVSITMKGDSSDLVDYAMDELIVNPKGLGGDHSACTSGSHACSASPGVGDGLTTGYDLALVRIKIGPHQPSPDSLVTPIPILTSIVDDNATYVPGTVHHRLDRAADFGAASATRPLFIGFGRDTAAMGYRHKGRGVFQKKGWDWDQQCQNPFTCNDVPNPSLLCALTGARGQYQLTDVRIDRTSTVVAYDGPLPGKGDSGGPLLLIGGYDIGNVLDLPTGQPFILGAMSVGNQSDTGVLIPAGSSQSGYAPTYANGNGAWIEQSLTALRASVTAPTCTASADCGSSRVNVGCTSLAAPLVFERDAGSGFSPFASLTSADAARPLSVNDDTGGSGTVRYRVCNTKSADRLCSSVMSVSVPGAACPPPMKCPKGTFACGVPGDYTCVPSGHYCM